MKVILKGTFNYTKILAGDKPEFGGAYHKYFISRSKEDPENKDVPAGEFGFVQFQKGPIKEFGINGCHHEDLLNIVLDRLETFQHTQFACDENEMTIIKIKEALHWLNHRTLDRMVRGVEGTFKK